MGKTLLYILVLGILGYGVYYFIFRDKDMFGVDEAGFTFTDTAGISKIFIAGKNNNTVLLERKKEGGWTLNGKYAVMPTPLNTLLATLKMQKALYPVPERVHNDVVAQLSATGIKVELYDKEQHKLRVFYVGGQANNIAGTYMLVEGAKRPYVVQIPGFEGYVTPRYSTDIKDWRDRTIYDIPSEELKEVKLTYASEPLNSFALFHQDSNNISVVVDSAIMKGQTLNKRRASVYTKFFEKLYCEGYINGIAGLDSVIAASPQLCTIDIISKNGVKHHMEIFWMALNKRSKNMLTPNPKIPVAYDADRMYATINNFKDTILIQRATFDKILRRGFEFYQPDNDQPEIETPRQKDGAGSFHK